MYDWDDAFFELWTRTALRLKADEKPEALEEFTKAVFRMRNTAELKQLVDLIVR